MLKVTFIIFTLPLDLFILQCHISLVFLFLDIFSLFEICHMGYDFFAYPVDSICIELWIAFAFYISMMQNKFVSFTQAKNACG